MNTKWRWESFSFYDRSGIVRRLEAMAAQGWMLEDITPVVWKYRRCPPRRLRFAVTYYPKATIYDPAPSQEQEFFYELCAHDGWELAASSGEMQIFCNDYPAPTPIETDPALEVETIHKLAWRRLLLPWGLLLIVSLYAVIKTGFSFWNAPLDILASGGSLTAFCAGLLCLPLSAAELWCYLNWESQARQAAQRGVFLETKSRWRLQAFVLLALLACLISWMLTSPPSEWYLVLGVLLAVLLAAVLRVFMKWRGVDAEMTQGAVYSVLMGTVWLVVTFSPLLPLERQTGVWEWEQNAPLSTVEMMGHEEGPRFFCQGQKSVLMERFRYSEPAFYGEYYSFSVKELSYTVNIPRFAPLYEFGRIVLLWEWGDGVRKHSESMDPGPWGAKEAYQCFDLYEREYVQYHYLLFYDQVLVELDLRREVTPEQMAVVAACFQDLDLEQKALFGKTFGEEAER